MSQNHAAGETGGRSIAASTINTFRTSPLNHAGCSKPPGSTSQLHSTRRPWIVMAVRAKHASPTADPNSASARTFVGSGGQAKHLVRSGTVTVNDSVETQPGRKLRAGDRFRVGEGDEWTVRP